MWGVDTNGCVTSHWALWKRAVVPYFFNVQVKELVRLSLNQPVKLFVDSNTDTAYNLQQEFVRIRTKHEGDREAVVAGASQSSIYEILLCCYFPKLYALDLFMTTVCCF